MVQTGSYELGNTNGQPKKDTSFKSFICAMLVVLVLCIVLLIGMHLWSVRKKGKEQQSEAEVFDPNMQERDFTAKIIMSTTKEGPHEVEETTPTPKIHLKTDTSSRKSSDTTMNSYTQKITTSASQTAQTYSTEGLTTKSPTPTEKLPQTSIKTDSETTHLIADDKQSSETFMGTTEAEIFLKNVTSQSSILSEIPTTGTGNNFQSFTTIIESITHQFLDDNNTRIVSTTNLLPGTTDDANKEFDTTPSILNESSKFFYTTIITTLINTENPGGITTSLQSSPDTTIYYKSEKDLATTTAITSSPIKSQFDRTQTVVEETETTPLLLINSNSLDSSSSSEGKRSDLISTTDTYFTTQNLNNLDDRVFFPSESDVSSSRIRQLNDSDDNNISVVESKSFSSESTPREMRVSSSDLKQQVELLRSASLMDKRPPCVSPRCKRESASLLSDLDFGVDSCENFYNFACGNWEEPKYSKIDDIIFSSMRDYGVAKEEKRFLSMFKNFFRSCVDFEDELKYETYQNKEKRIENLKLLYKTLGNFYENGTAIDETTLTDLFANLILTQTMMIFDVGINVAGDHKYILQLTTPSSSVLKNGLSSWKKEDEIEGLAKEKIDLKLKLSSANVVNLEEVYENYLYSQQKNKWLFLADSMKNTLDELEISPYLSEEIRATFTNISSQFHVRFSGNDRYKTKINLAKVQETYEQHTIPYLQEKYPIIDWQRFFEKLVNSPLSFDTEIQIYFEEEYFKLLFEEMKKVEKRKIYNALLGYAVFTFYENTVVTKEKHHREQYCLDLTKQLFPDVTTFMVQNFYPQNILSEKFSVAKNYFARLRKTLRQSFEKAEWLDKPSLDSLLMKLENLTLIFSDENLENEVIDLNNRYSFVMVDSTKTYQENLITSLQTYKTNIYAVAREQHESIKTSLFNFFIPADRLKAKTFYSSNFIAVPINVLNLYDRNLPDFVNLPRMGWHLAKALSQHFDSVGLVHGVDFFSEEAMKEYNRMIGKYKLIPNFGRPYENVQLTYKFQSSLSLSEQISDHAALRLLTDTVMFPGSAPLPFLLPVISNEEVFYIEIAQQFCEKSSLTDFMLKIFEKETLPSVLRVNDMLLNEHFFLKSCKEGSGMRKITLLKKPQFPYLKTTDDANSGYNTFSSGFTKKHLSVN